MVWSGAVRMHLVRSNVMAWCGSVWCVGVVWNGVVHAMMLCGTMWCDNRASCGPVWCGTVWWCGTCGKVLWYGSTVWLCGVGRCMMGCC